MEPETFVGSVLIKEVNECPYFGGGLIERFHSAHTIIYIHNIMYSVYIHII